jgi:hypothetical protein
LEAKLSRERQRIARWRAASGLLLLILTAHAFVASATHFHHLTSLGADSTQTALLNREESGKSTPLAGDDAQCLLCRLQRNFASAVPHAVPTATPLLADAVEEQSLQETAVSTARSLLRSGRAPPLA